MVMSRLKPASATIIKVYTFKWIAMKYMLT